MRSPSVGVRLNRIVRRGLLRSPWGFIAFGATGIAADSVTAVGDKVQPTWGRGAIWLSLVVVGVILHWAIASLRKRVGAGLPFSMVPGKPLSVLITARLAGSDSLRRQLDQAFGLWVEDRYQEASTILNKCLATERLVPEEGAAVLFLVGRVLQEAERFRDAEEIFDEALAVLPERKRKVRILRLLLCVSRASAIGKQCRPEEALGLLAGDATRLASGLSRHLRGTWSAYVDGNIGLIQREMGALGDAEKTFERAVEKNTKAGWTPGRAEALANLGIVRTKLGKFKSAGEVLDKALALERRSGRREHEVRSMGHLGRLKAAQGLFPEADRQLQRALSICDELVGSEKERANCLVAIANVHNAWYESDHEPSHLESALNALSKALTVEREIGYWWGAAQTLANMGKIRREMGIAMRDGGMFDQARHDFEEAVAVAHDHLGDYTLSRTLTSLGSYLHWLATPPWSAPDRTLLTTAEDCLISALGLLPGECLRQRLRIEGILARIAQVIHTTPGPQH